MRLNTQQISSQFNVVFNESTIGISSKTGNNNQEKFDLENKQKLLMTGSVSVSIYNALINTHVLL